MLNEHTLNQLRSLRLDGMLRAIEEQASAVFRSVLNRPAFRGGSFD